MAPQHLPLAALAFLPIALHWLVFFVHAGPHCSEKYFDLTGQVALLTMLHLSWHWGGQGGNAPAPLLPLVCGTAWSVRLGWL